MTTSNPHNETPTFDPNDDECVAEFIDGSWTYADCGCVDCCSRLAEDGDL